MAIGTVEFDLSMIDQETGLNMTARAYTVEGITNADGSLRELSIGQLVMAICLDRASKLEASIITLMEEMNDTSGLLESLTDIENQIVSFFSNTPQATVLSIDPDAYPDQVVKTGPYEGLSWQKALFYQGIIPSLDVKEIRNDGATGNNRISYPDFVTNIEAKMDEKNSFSQQKMIELQSQTSKRDQAYDMISNILKSLNTVLVGNANNL